MSTERRCAMGTLCRDWTLVDSQRVPALLTKPAGLCDKCVDWFSTWVVGGLQDNWLKLELTLGEHRKLKQENTRRPKPGSRIPLNTATDALMRDIEVALDEAADAVAEKMAMKRRRMRPGLNSNRQMYRRVRTASRIVGPNADKLLAHEEGMRLVKRLVLLNSQCTRHLGETMQREKLHLPCPVCGASALGKEVRDLRGREYHSDDKGGDTPEVVSCRNCKGSWTEAEYQWLSRMVLTEREKLNMVEWLLAEARWERDVNAWLAAERLWLLDLMASMLDIDGAADLIERARTVAA